MPDPFLSICPHCHAKLKLKDSALIGKLARCPSCQQKFTVKKAVPSVKAKREPTAASPRTAKPAARSKPTPPPDRDADDELDPWLQDDLSRFDDDTDAAAGANAVSAPPPVRGISRKRKSSAGQTSSKKRSKRSVDAEQVSWIGWVVCGSIAGLIGASAWGAIAAFTFTEWGILAWGIGGFVGFGVRVGAREEDVGLAPGLTALGIAMFAVILGKFLAVHFLLASLEKAIEAAGEVREGQAQQLEVSDQETIDLIISDFADEVEAEWAAQGRQWNEPDWDNVPDNASWEAYYDPVIWAEAKQKWEALSPEEQAKMIVEYKTGKFDIEGNFDEIKGEMFAASFGVLDLLFFFLAAVTAFKVGSGLDFGDE